MTPTSLITLLLLIVLYALAWHDKPGHQVVKIRSGTRTRNDRENEC